MFRKLVSNLPYSPALIADIGFYAKRLRDEEVTRRTTTFFIVLTLIMQSLAIFSPPESANASSEQDIIRGGVSDLADFLIRYDRNEEDIKDIYGTAGVSRSEILSVQPGTIYAKDNTYVMSRYGGIGATNNEVSMAYQRSTGGMGMRYFSPLASMGGSEVRLKGWIGRSATLGWFGIVQSSGSLATQGLPTSIDPADATMDKATKTVSATNLSQGAVPIETTIGKPLDRISYSLKLSNPRSTSTTAAFSVQLSDVLEYATLIDGGGGTFDAKTSTLSWPNVQLAPGQSQERTFAVQLMSEFPVTAVGLSNPASYDCNIALVFGNRLKTPIECSPIKTVEGIFHLLPPTDPLVLGITSAFLLTVVLFFYVRTVQLKKETRIVRHNFNSGAY